ncbi:hypothetical protein UPTC5050_0782 [Campylobacter lari]
MDFFELLEWHFSLSTKLIIIKYGLFLIIGLTSLFTSFFAFCPTTRKYPKT